MKWEVNDKFLSKITRSEIVELVRDWYKQKSAAEDEKALRKINRETNKGLKRPDKYITCSSKKKAERQLWIFEGDSARSSFRNCRNPEFQAGYTMRGVPPNVYGMTPLQIMKNEVFNDIVTVLGLKWGKEFSLDELNFGKIVISTDADVDGDKIASLLLLFFNKIVNFCYKVTFTFNCGRVCYIYFKSTSLPLYTSFSAYSSYFA